MSAHITCTRYTRWHDIVRSLSLPWTIFLEPIASFKIQPWYSLLISERLSLVLEEELRGGLLAFTRATI